MHYNSRGGPGGGGGTLTLRLPGSYLAVDAAAADGDDDIGDDTDDDSGLPEVITARDGSNDDIRNETRRMMMVDLELRHGEEVLDQVLMAFDDLVDARGGGDGGHHDDHDHDHDYEEGDGDGGQNQSHQSHQSHHGQDVKTSPPQYQNSRPKTKTVIIWLHHLLATSKRKLATSPPTAIATATATTRTTSKGTGTSTSTSTKPSPTTTTTTTSLSGVSKPGYPGILIYSGARDLVDAHVRDLRALKWQAFQVRWDSAEEEEEEEEERRRGEMDEEEDTRGMTTEWEFTHDKGKVVEVATMAELVGAVVREKHRKVVLGVLGVK